MNVHRTSPGVFLAVACLFLGADTPENPAPRTRWEHTTHDFGTLAADAKVDYRWPVHNDGTAPLEIVNTFPSCGCTASLIEGGPIAPGKSGSLLVTFNAAGQQGDVRKTIAVVTTDPAKPRTILTIKAKVLPPANPRVSAGHPPIQGQSLLGAGCAECHAKPAAGKTGEPLFAAVCAMCHGADANGGLANGLRDADYLASRDDRALADAIAFGTANPRMPGFSVDMGGPLTPAQIDSIVRQLRAWGPVSRRPAAAPPAPR
ncbi:MAG TPA: DUF1573 domain-containing protein [Candidatus Polarisedimenticolaceae bacterium]